MFVPFFYFEKKKISHLTKWDFSSYVLSAECAETIPDGSQFKLSRFSADISKFRISGWCPFIFWLKFVPLLILFNLHVNLQKLTTLHPHIQY